MQFVDLYPKLCFGLLYRFLLQMFKSSYLVLWDFILQVDILFIILQYNCKLIDVFFKFKHTNIVMGHKKNLEEKCSVGNSEIVKQRIIEKEPENKLPFKMSQKKKKDLRKMKRVK